MFGLFRRHKNNPCLPQSKNCHGYVGKTRQCPDFVKLNVSSREAVALDHWIQEGFAVVSRDGAKRHDSASMSATSVYFMAGGEEAVSLLGVIQPSLDSCERDYPFVSFVHCDAITYKKHPSTLFLNAGHLIEQLFTVSADLSDAPSVNVMVHQAGALKDIALQLGQGTDLGHLLDTFRHIPMLRLWQGIAMAEIDQRADFIQQSCQVLSTVSARGCLRCHLGVRFPMPGLGKSPELVAAFWLHLMTMRVADHHWRPWLFYHLGDAHHRPSMTVFTRPVAASYFEGIWDLGKKNQNIVDIADLPRAQSISEGAGALALLENMSMYDALRRWCQC